MGFKGDFKGMDAMIAKMDAMGEAVPNIAKSAAPELQVVIADAVTAGRDPYGAGLAPRVDGGVAFASLGGTVAGPAKVTARGKSIFARVTRKVPRYMTRGRKAGGRGGFMPARPIIPEPDGAVPSPWLDVLNDAADAAMGEKGKR